MDLKAFPAVFEDRRSCRNGAQGCMHQDTHEKCMKHEAFFCEHTEHTLCNICEEGIPRDAMSSHCASAHRDVTHSAGAAWRAIREAPQRCLVSCPVGNALCMYRLGYSDMNVYVYIPVTSERLCEFCCEVRVTQPTTGLESIHTPDVIYDRFHDWHLQVDKQDFPCWNMQFDIAINIRKK